MNYPFLTGVIVLGLAWLIGATVERYRDAARIAAVLATIALLVQSILWLCGL